jgi:hypothetical protein
MIICPVAIAIGCRKCPIFAFCPVKTVIGDQKPSSRAGKSDPANKPESRSKSRR